MYKKIIINGFDLFNEKSFGIHRSALEIARGIDALLDNRKENLVVELAVPRGYYKGDFQNIVPVTLDCEQGTQRAKIVWRRFIFQRYVKAESGIGLDMTLGLPTSGRYCVFDYDCILENRAKEYYSFLPGIRRLHYMNRVRSSLRGAEIVFTDSQYAKREIHKLYECPEDKIVVIPCSWQHMLRITQDDGVLGKFGLSDKEYFFALGSRYPYKNFRWIECAAQQNPSYRFVVTGHQIGPEIEKSGDVPENLLFTGYLSDEEIKGLMAHCRAFLHPSLDEGFGIPPLEAMSVGAECIISNRAALPEVYGDSVRYIDPLSYRGIDLDAILSVPTRGSAAAVLDRYSWIKSANTVLSAIEERCFR